LVSFEIDFELPLQSKEKLKPRAGSACCSMRVTLKYPDRSPRLQRPPHQDFNTQRLYQLQR